MNLFDTHAHVSSKEYESDIEHIFEHARKNHVTHILDVATDQETLDRSLSLRPEGITLLHAAARHPHDAEGEDTFLPLIKEEISKLSAIGEIGLDYFYQHASKKRQQEVLISYLELATSKNLPVIIHCRDAFPDFFSIFDSFSKGISGVVHCFTGTQEDAKASLDRGLFLSFSGIVTFEKSQKLQEIVRNVPMDSFFVETDAPFLAPVPFRGKRNEPAYVSSIVEKIALIKGITFDAVCASTFHNAKRLFKLL